MADVDLENSRAMDRIRRKRSACRTEAVWPIRSRIFAAREGLDAQRLYVWRRKLEPRAGFVEVTPPTALELREASRGFEVALRCARSFDCQRFDADALRRLVDVLEVKC